MLNKRNTSLDPVVSIERKTTNIGSTTKMFVVSCVSSAVSVYGLTMFPAM